MFPENLLLKYNNFYLHIIKSKIYHNFFCFFQPELNRNLFKIEKIFNPDSFHIIKFYCIMNLHLRYLVKYIIPIVYLFFNVNNSNYYNRYNARDSTESTIS